MSEYDGSDEIDIEGGFFEEAGVNAEDVPDDPFNFGNEFWPIVIVEVGKPKVTAKKDKIGMMVKIAVDHPRFSNSFVGKQMGNGDWYRLPIPLAIRDQIPWNPEGEEEQQAVYKLGVLYTALGFPKDQWKTINGARMTGKRFLAKIKVSTDDKGFWQFRLNSPKVIGEGSDSGWGELGPQSSNQGGGGKSAADLLKEELDES